MGIRSKVKKAGKSVSKSVSHVTSKIKKETNRLGNQVSKALGVDGTFAGDALNTVTQYYVGGNYLNPAMLDFVDNTTRLATGQSGTKQKIMNDINKDIYSGFQRQAEKQAALAKAAGEANAEAARAAEAAAWQQAILQKNALIAEQESAKALPVTEGYLAPSGVIGGYRDQESKRKKRLGGDK